MSVSKGETFKAIIAHQPRFHLVLLGSLGLALLGSSFIKVNKRGLLLYDTPSAFLVDEKSERLPVRFARGFGEPALARQVAVASAAPMAGIPQALPLDTAETVGGSPVADSPATRLIAPRGSSAVAAAPTAGSPRTGGLPGIPSSGFMLSPAGPFLANPGSGGGNTPGNGDGGAGNGGNGSDPGTGTGGGETGGGDNGGGNTGGGDNGGNTGGGDNGGNPGGGNTGGGDNGGNGGGIDPGDGGGDPGGGIDPGDGGGNGGDPIDTGGGDAPAVPEPAAWLMMIIGVGALGRMLRRQGDAQPQVALAPARNA